MNKENAVADYIDMIEKSWTWNRLTDDEINAFRTSVDWADEQGIIKGNYKHRWLVLQAMYETMLNTLGYKPFGWREE